MGLLNSYNEWKNSRYERHISLMKDRNKCPECYGRGYYIFPANEFIYNVPPYDCHACNGTGSFGEWTITKETT